MKRLNDRNKITVAEPGTAAHAWAAQLEPEGTTFLVLAHTPEQLEDIFRILVDDRLVLAFEVSREPGSMPQEIVRYGVYDFRRTLGGRDVAAFDAALSAARRASQGA